MRKCALLYHTHSFTIAPLSHLSALFMDMQKALHLHGIARILVLDNLLSEKQVALYQSIALRQKISLLQYIAHEKIICSQQIASSIARFFAMPSVDLNSFDIKTLPVDLIHITLIVRYRMIPLFQKGNQLHIATDDPSQQEALQDIQFHTGYHVSPHVVDTHQLTAKITQLLHHKENQGLTDYVATKKIEQKNPATKAVITDEPVVNFVNRILLEAISQGVSDIHFEPYENAFRIRYRQDGMLITVATPPSDLSARITARLKVMAQLDTSERRIPQDGRFKMNTIDFRISTCPTVCGEKIVLRLLDARTTQCHIDSLGFLPFQKDQFLKAIAKPEGMILVTGPTGSGKTMTLYSALRVLNTIEKNISTVEDPVEINVPGINQVNINPKAGLGFANTLRAFLRQDPDIIMVGEIRDLETAEMAIKASHTGHLVLSTLHTNSAAETLTRLLHIGVPAFNIASSVRLIVAQRLVRRLCATCKYIRTDLTPADLMNIGFSKSDANSMNTFQARGCSHCTHGFRGRIALFEVMPISRNIAQTIMAGCHAIDLLEQAKSEGMLTLFQAGLEQIKQGVTNIEEIQRSIID